ncbi:uncharacterized protein LOC109851029 isoform X2 [Asparagus officinalis]|uniref:uncharacterized protein LOC109851029 isoform X2 n=1 Tax=Asparagus officinalis TaxID=4686 RepID=UPI00098E8661|nr:uncharacterized protein LOC109851029 isoform X2 [Asparagus officinalis]
MRLRKGSKVEVLSRREVPSGSWFCAEIISGNGRYYNVKFDPCLPNGGCDMKKVQRKNIRPCPPSMFGLGNLVPGDTIEVFENNSWKPAKMIQVLDGGNYFVVVIVGSSEELEVPKSNIRLRLSWIGNRWISVDKHAENFTEGKVGIQSKVGKVNHQRLQQWAGLKKRKGDDKCDDGHYHISLRGLKKRKMGAVRKEGKRQLPEKVDACVSSQGQSWRPEKLASVGPRCW